MTEQPSLRNAPNVRQGHSRIQQVQPVVPLAQQALSNRMKVNQSVNHVEPGGIAVTHQQIRAMEVLHPVHQGHLTNYLGVLIQTHVFHVQRVHIRTTKKVLHNAFSALTALIV